MRKTKIFPKKRNTSNSLEKKLVWKEKQEKNRDCTKASKNMKQACKKRLGYFLCTNAAYLFIQGPVSLQNEVCVTFAFSGKRKNAAQLT